MMLRFLICFTYLVLLLPWPLAVLTGWIGFTILGFLYLLLGVILAPKAARDWKFEAEIYR